MKKKNPNLSDEEMDTYGYRYDDWEMNMRDLADDFYKLQHVRKGHAVSSGIAILRNRCS